MRKSLILLIVLLALTVPALASDAFPPGLEGVQLDIPEGRGFALELVALNPGYGVSDGWRSAWWLGTVYARPHEATLRWTTLNLGAGVYMPIMGSTALEWEPSMGSYVSYYQVDATGMVITILTAHEGWIELRYGLLENTQACCPWWDWRWGEPDMHLIGNLLPGMTTIRGRPLLQ